MSSSPSEPALVPELLVTDLQTSLAFWCGLCGFRIEYERAEERFAYISLGSAHLMLEQLGVGRNWITAALEPPLGRGINLQIGVPSLAPILEALRTVHQALFMTPETKWYRVADDEEVGVEQFLVADPDGYLIRFQTALGTRPITAEQGDP